MKKFFAVSFALGLLPSMAFARGNHTMAGCGLGYVLFAHEDNSKIMQVIGATVNGTGTQTFGITSGTSGCTEDGAVKFVKEAEVFAEVNLESLRREMAMGQGEFVTAFASLLGASAEKVPQMVRFFNAEYATLFPSADTTSAELLASLQAALANHPKLLS